MNAQGHFTKSVQSFGPAMRPAFFADLNGDGFVDVVCDNIVYLNDQRFLFSEKRRLPTEVIMANAHLADLNGDGFPDLLIGEPRGARLYFNDGKGNFADSGLRLGNANSVDAAVGDLTGDGKPDVFVANVRNINAKEGACFNEVWLNTTMPVPIQPPPSLIENARAVH